MVCGELPFGNDFDDPYDADNSSRFYFILVIEDIDALSFNYENKDP